jgi:hypothetical protein
MMGIASLHPSYEGESSTPPNGLSLQQCGKLPGNPLIDADGLLQLPDADALRGLVSNVDTAGTHDQRRRHAAVLGGFGPYPHDTSLAADGFFHGAHQRRIGWKLGRRRFRPHLDVEPVSGRGTPDFLDDRTRRNCR